MMKLNIMNDVLATMDNNYKMEINNTILSRWTDTNPEIDFYNASGNFISMFRLNDKLHILRYISVLEKSTDEIAGEIKLLNHLSSNNFIVQKPVLSLSGNYVETINTPSGEFHAVVFEAVEGDFKEAEDTSKDDYYKIGEKLALLHINTSSEKVSHIKRHSWKDDFLFIKENLSENDTISFNTFYKLEREISAIKTTHDNYGIIHFDYETDNILWQEDKIGIIDFDSSAYYWFAADIAFSVRRLFDDSYKNFDFNNENLQSFLSGYEKIRKLSEEEKRVIPLFLCYNNLYQHASINYSLKEIDITDKNPLWVNNLIKKLRDVQNNYMESFKYYTEVIR